MNLTEVRAVVSEEWQLLKLLGYNTYYTPTAGIRVRNQQAVFWRGQHENLVRIAVQTIPLMLEKGLGYSNFNLLLL